MGHKKKSKKLQIEVKTLRRDRKDLIHQFERMKSFRHYYEKQCQVNAKKTRKAFAMLNEENKAYMEVLHAETLDVDRWRETATKRGWQRDDLQKNLNFLQQENARLMTQRSLMFNSFPTAFERLSEGHPEIPLLKELSDHFAKVTDEQIQVYGEKSSQSSAAEIRVTSYGSDLKPFDLGDYKSDFQLLQPEPEPVEIVIHGRTYPPNCPQTSRNGRPLSRYAPHRWADMGVREVNNDEFPDESLGFVGVDGIPLTIEELREFNILPPLESEDEEINQFLRPSPSEFVESEEMPENNQEENFESNSSHIDPDQLDNLLARIGDFLENLRKVPENANGNPEQEDQGMSVRENIPENYLEEQKLKEETNEYIESNSSNVNAIYDQVDQAAKVTEEIESDQKVEKIEKNSSNVDVEPDQALKVPKKFSKFKRFRRSLSALFKCVLLSKK